MVEKTSSESEKRFGHQRGLNHQNLCGYEKSLRWLLSWWVLDAAGCIPNTYENSWYVYREKSGTRRW